MTLLPSKLTKRRKKGKKPKAEANMAETAEDDIVETAEADLAELLKLTCSIRPQLPSVMLWLKTM